MIVPSTARWNLTPLKADPIPIIAWWIDESSLTATPRPITPLGLHLDPSTYRLDSNFGVLSPTPGKLYQEKGD